MKIKNAMLISVLMLAFPAGVFALETPDYEAIPASVSSKTYTLNFTVESGAKVTVIGGSSDISPVTDGVGNALDGKVSIEVGLSEGKNIFSVIAQKDADTSDSITVTIYKTASGGGNNNAGGDSVAPEKPVIDPYPTALDVTRYRLTGTTEADANVSARKPDGSLMGATRADSKGIFAIPLVLTAGQTNRVNVSAEDGAGNVGDAVQVVIQVSANATTPAELNGEEGLRVARFVDIRGHWAEDFVKTLYADGIINGKTEDRFDPDERITRAELTKIAVNAFGLQVPSSVTQKPFADVAVSAWFAPYVQAAKEAGIVQGFPDGFHPNDFVDRAAALKILFEASGLAVTSAEVNFSDVPGDSWFKSYVVSAASYDIVSGYADGTFRPGASITRAEVSKIVVKLLELKP